MPRTTVHHLAYRVQTLQDALGPNYKVDFQGGSFSGGVSHHLNIFHVDSEGNRIKPGSSFVLGKSKLHAENVLANMTALVHLMEKKKVK